MMTFINSDPPPQLEKALSAIEMVFVGIVTFAQPQQEVQLQYTPSEGITSIIMESEMIIMLGNTIINNNVNHNNHNSEINSRIFSHIYVKIHFNGSEEK